MRKVGATSRPYASVSLAATLFLFAPQAFAQHQHEPQAHPPEHAEHAPPQASHDDHASPPEMNHAMSGALGPYVMSRDASGTAWQPDASAHTMRHTMRGDWMLMGHVLLNGVYSWQDGPRGDEKAFVAGMIMGVARRDLANGDVIQFRGMLSPDPFMGGRGYPLLLAAGETADGVTPLVDRQHPHDLFMELSGSYAHRLSNQDSVFVYVGYPSEPAFGPPAFMHRLSAMDSPEAPITHHWFDSTHITFGVVTAGWVHGDWKIEASQFTGREPDDDRYDFDEPQFDSTSARVSWNPGERWSLQASWADIESPEQLEPDVDETRWSVSAAYTVPLGEGSWWSTTLAYGEKDPSDAESLSAVFLESTYRPNRDWTIFGRAEQIDSHDLVHHSVERVSKLSLGAIRDFAIADNVAIGVGALYSFNFVPDDLEPLYDGDPEGAMAFIRLRMGG